MKTSALLLALLCGAAAAQDAPKRFAEAVRVGTFIQTDGGVIQADGGGYMDSPTWIATGAELTDLRVQVVDLRKTQGQGIDVPTVVGLVVGAAAAGFAAAKLLK